MRTERRGNPLFDLEGVYWDDLNMRVLAYNFAAAKRLADILLTEGYKASSVEWHDRAGVVTVRFHDVEGRHIGRENGQNDHITMVCFQAEGFRGVGVVYKENGQWHEFTGGGLPTTVGDCHIESRISYCRQLHPNAEIKTWDVGMLGMPVD